MSQALYILHGWSTNDHDQKWQPFLEQLRKRDLKPIFLRIPGLSAPLEEVWDLDDYTRWLEKELLGKKDVILLGHSFGGQLAIRYAALHQRQLRKLILVAAAGIRDKSPKAIIKRAVFWWLAKIGKLLFPFAMARTILYRLARERDYQNAPPLLRRTMSLILDAEVVDEAAKVATSTLLIWGRGDKTTPLANGIQYQQVMPQAHLEIIDEARHSPHFTHSTVVAKLVADFVKGRTSSE